MNVEKLSHEVNKHITNGTSSVFGKYWEYLIDELGIPLGHYCVKILYLIYTNFTIFNVLLFLLKCIPTGIYMHRFIKNVYVTAQDRMKVKQLELDDIKLQIQIVNTKISVRDTEFTDRKKLLRKKADHLNKLRAKVRELIAADDELQNALHDNTQWDQEMNYTEHTAEEEECTFIVELLKELKYDQVLAPEMEVDKMSGGDPSEQRAEGIPETSAYSTTSEGGKQDCQIKIIKVTNVYKVAYLRHYIKQRRQRRANKQALFRKKMDSIKKLLDEWHRTLNMVIHNKLLLNMDSQYIQIASQEAMGDCSKHNFYVFSDSDSDFRNSADNCHDDYTDYNGENAYTREYCDPKEYGNNNDYDEQCICNRRSGDLFRVPEETRSQIEIEEIKGDAD